MINHNILFLGDSITAGFNLKKYFPGENFDNRAVSGDSTVECLERLTPDSLQKAYDYIFICIGTNDLARERSDEEIIHHITEIISRVRLYQNEAKIILTSLFPTRKNTPRPNERIVSLNKKLCTAAGEMSVSFFDLHPNFTDDAGSLKPEFTDDGLHLTESAYLKWSGILDEYLSKPD